MAWVLWKLKQLLEVQTVLVNRQPSHRDASLAQTCPPLSLVTSLPPIPPAIGRNMPPAPNARLPSINSILHIDIFKKGSFDGIPVTNWSEKFPMKTPIVLFHSIIICLKEYLPYELLVWYYLDLQSIGTSLQVEWTFLHISYSLSFFLWDPSFKFESYRWMAHKILEIAWYFFGTRTSDSGLSIISIM